MHIIINSFHSEQLTKCTGVTFDMEVALSAYMKLVLLCDTGLVLESWEHLKGYCMQLKNDWCQKLKINLSRYGCGLLWTC